MNMDLDHVESLSDGKTKAFIVVMIHYGGLCKDMDRLNKIVLNIIYQ